MTSFLFHFIIPPRRVDYEEESDLLSKYFTSGSVLTVRERINESESVHVREPIRRIIPADNSCLFHALIKTKGLDLQSDDLRDIVISIITSDIIQYNSTFLGKDPIDYCNWIRQSSSWGGEIELSILSNYHVSCRYRDK